MQIIIEPSQSDQDVYSRLNDMADHILKLKDEGSVKIDISLITITDKQFRALHLWFRKCDHLFIKEGIVYYGALSRSPRKWREGDFKAGVYKPFLFHYKGITSTKDQGTKTPDECLQALSGHIATEKGITLPEWPSLDNMSFSKLLSG